MTNIPLYTVFSIVFIFLTGVLTYTRINESYLPLKSIGKINPDGPLTLPERDGEELLQGDYRDFGRDGIINGHHPITHRKVDDINNRSSSTTV